MSKPVYYWQEGKVVIPEERVILTDTLCVDTGTRLPQWRYGMFPPIDSGRAGWDHVPLEDFPKEFRLQLLLLGVT